MRCEVHCPPEGGALAGAVAVAVLVAVFAVVVSVAAAVVASLAEAAALAVLAVCVVLSWPTWRLVRYGDRREVFRRHRHARRPVVSSRLAVNRAAVSRELPAGSSLRALPAPGRVIEGVVLDDMYERTEAR